ncbi:MAG: hypothetical protein Q7P63_10575 [Verrucomicrobiota bacterium JB022]|nr:hypothetical protein [Verrucomicrobiota bacterium JB022]
MLGFMLSWTGGALLVSTGWTLVAGTVTLAVGAGIALAACFCSWAGFKLLNRESSERHIRLRPRRDEWIGPRPY